MLLLGGSMSAPDRDPDLDAKAIRTLARSIYRTLQESGYSQGHVVDLASAMLELVVDRRRPNARL